MEDFRRIEVSLLSGSAGQIVLVYVLDRQVFEPYVIQEVYQDLLSVLKSSTSKNLVLDLSRVQYVSSGALNRLLDFKKRVATVAGSLRLCGLCPEIAEIFEITRLDRQFEIASDQTAALATF